MACPEQNCDLTAVSATLSGSDGTFDFTEYVGAGDLVEFGDTEFESTSQYSNTKNVVRFSGESIPRIQITINAFPCDPTWESLWSVHIRNTLACFSQLVVNDPCCTARRFIDVRILSMSPSNISADDTVSPVVLEATPI